MRAVILWPGDPTTDPPRPTLIGDDQGRVFAREPGFAWLDAWGGLYRVPTERQAVRLAQWPDLPIIPLREYAVSLPDGAVWTIQAAYSPEAATWFVRCPLRAFGDPPVPNPWIVCLRRPTLDKPCVMC